MRVRNLAIAAACIGLAVGEVALAGTGTPGMASPQATIGPRAVPFAAPSPAYGLFTCQTGEAPFVCYDPYEMRRAYGTEPLINAGYDGTGRTIVIIDAFHWNGLEADVDAFSGFYGLPLSNAFLTTYTPDGLPPENLNWAGEITLDVEWAHAIAPGAQIALVLAKSNNDDDLVSALNYAIDNNLGDVVSMSFGENESCLDQATTLAWHTAFTHATQKGITLFASSGDQGAAQQTCDGNSWTLAASSPASDPLVSGVGGTELHASDYVCDANSCDGSSGGIYQGEIAWNEVFCADNACDLFESEATGGGVSVIWDAPPFQKSGVKSKGRTVPDVAYNAAILHGVLVFFEGFPQLIGGTSAGSPQWAAIVAIADQVAGRRLGYLNSAFYQIRQTAPNYGASFHDVTVGDNSAYELDASNSQVVVLGYPALPAWDATTGIGSPKADGLIGRLIAFTSAGDTVAAIATSKPHAQAHVDGPQAMQSH